MLTIKQGPQENPRSYVQRFNSESLRVDIPDEKFAITAFIVGLGIQSKDLMFSISKNPHASMAEVLVKAEKYINDEEALMSKRGSSFAQKEKSKDKKKRDRSPRRRKDPRAQNSKEPCSSVQRRLATQISKELISSIQRRRAAQTSKEPGARILESHVAQFDKSKELGY